MNYKFDSIVNRNEANALKEMIFSRARERAQSMTESVQADVMELARDSFVSKNNPFSAILSEQSEKQKNTDIVELSTENKTEIISQTENKQNITEQPATENKSIGFPQKQFAPRAIAQNREINYQISSSAIYNNMAEARDGLTRKPSFMGALDFLNAQAAVSLARVHRADRFEMVV